MVQKTENAPKRRRKKYFAAIPVTLLAVFGLLLADSNVRLVTDRFRLGGERLPAPFEGFRIVHLSDLHTKSFGKNNERLFDAVRAEEPDIIVLTGDIIDKARAEAYVAELAAGLTAIAPVYYVSGNHEWGSGWAREVFTLLEAGGVTVLRNEYVTLQRGDASIVLAGVDDPNGLSDQKSPRELVEEIREREGDKYILMLSHRNTELAMWARLGVDAVLSGHAHGGQWRLPFTDGLVAPGQGLFPTWTSGIYTDGGTSMLVSRGLGNARHLPRLFNNPEVVSVTLSKNLD